MNRVQVLWRRRDLVLALATSEFKGRYRRLGLGVLWGVINPLVQATLIAAVFSFVARFEFPFPYALFVLAGMMPWNFFVLTLTAGTSSLITASTIVERVALPRASIPSAVLLGNLFNLGFMILTLLVVSLVLAPDRLTHLWLLPAAVVLETVLVYGMILITSPLNVRYRDVGQFVTAATLAWFWVTPIVYPLSALAGHPLLRTLVRINPLTGVLSLYRGAFLAQPVDTTSVAVACGWAVALLAVGWVLFGRREADVADFI